MRRFTEVTPDQFDAVIAEACAYATEHPNDDVEVHLAAGVHTMTGAMPLIPPNVTIVGPQKAD